MPSAFSKKPKVAGENGAEKSYDLNNGLNHAEIVSTFTSKDTESSCHCS
jgi:hypothetical protein